MPDIKTIKEKYRKSIDPFDLELIISRVIKKPREFVIAHPEFKIIKNLELKIKNYVSKRVNGEPLAYALGEKEFYGLNFKVNKNVLVPRPETEMMIDEALALLKQENNKTIKQKNIIIDIGTGSGCIIISIVKNLINSKFEIRNSKFLAVDISRPALRVARQNAKLHKIDKKIKFLHGDLLKPIINEIKNKKLIIDNCKLIIAANLPYLTPVQIKNSPSIQYEPKLALDAGKDGLKYYLKLLKQIKSLIANYELQVTALLEMDPGQKNKITKLIKNHFPKSKIEIKKDLRGLYRLAIMEINRQSAV